MNTNQHMDAFCKSYLHALPQATPPAALRGRVLAARVPERSGRWPQLAALAAAAALCAVALRAVLAPVVGPEAHVPPSGTASDTMVASQALERRVLDRGMPADPALHAGIADIDRVLADAYRRRAGDEELDALWRARAQALDALDKGLASAPVVPARI